MTATPAPSRPGPSSTAFAAMFSVLTFSFVVATLTVGWWGVPAVAAAWAFWVRRGGRSRVAPAGIAAAGAALAWALLLAWTAARGPLVQLARTLGAVVGVPGAVLVVLTLAFSALLAWSAAMLVDG